MISHEKLCCQIKQCPIAADLPLFVVAILIGALFENKAALDNTRFLRRQLIRAAHFLYYSSA